MKILKNYKKIKFNFNFFPIYFLYILIFIFKYNLVFAITNYPIKKTNSFNQLINCSLKKMKNLEINMESLSEEQILIEEELKKLEEHIFYLKMIIKKEMSKEIKNLIELKIFILQEKKSFYKKKILNMMIKKIELKTKVNKYLKIFDNKKN
ncbi:hypothetical protein [Candidatus Phytoplasma sacchari]|uniref:Uncharacterized protein n=1 Tax=Candidatus Phytoplasma sacchari TaxID=2609813 RepID=A0ABY7M1J6_9MOLU|nr:hypothetical protein O7R10_00825 [Candidatus Phytoplasma sacchari]